MTILALDDIAALRRTLDPAGCETAGDVMLPGYQRFFISDPFRNRIEWMQRLDGAL